VLPALALWTVTFLAEIVWRRKQSSDISVKTGRSVGMLALVLATFLAVVFPYISTSKRIYGQYFYNVNSTFVIWCDSSTQAWVFLSVHGDKDQWRELPADQLPSLSKYWREHSGAQIARRLMRGSFHLATQNAIPIGYYKFVVALAVAAAILWARRRTKARQLLAEKPFATIFCALFFFCYFLLYAWYDAIINDSRFVLSIFLPFLFVVSLFVLRLGRNRRVRIAGQSVAFEKFFAALLLGLALIDVVYNAARAVG
jgi:hypothetical protein